MLYVARAAYTIARSAPRGGVQAGHRCGFAQPVVHGAGVHLQLRGSFEPVQATAAEEADEPVEGRPGPCELVLEENVVELVRPRPPPRGLGHVPDFRRQGVARAISSWFSPVGVRRVPRTSESSSPRHGWGPAAGRSPAGDRGYFTGGSPPPVGPRPHGGEDSAVHVCGWERGDRPWTGLAEPVRDPARGRGRGMDS